MGPGWFVRSAGSSLQPRPACRLCVHTRPARGIHLVGASCYNVAWRCPMPPTSSMAGMMSFSAMVISSISAYRKGVAKGCLLSADKDSVPSLQC